MESTNHTYTFNIDRGGTFTDFYVQEFNPGHEMIGEYVFKEPSTKNKREGPIEGIRKFLAGRMGVELNDNIPAASIRQINLGTTLATNALL